MKNALPGLVAKADTVGVFVPSVDESSIESCLDRQYSTYVSDLAASISHYPQTVLGSATSVSNLGLWFLHSLFSLPSLVLLFYCRRSTVQILKSLNIPENHEFLQIFKWVFKIHKN